MGVPEEDRPVRLVEASKSYGSVEALRATSFEARSGEAVALLGPNGAGKTTAISLMLGLRAPTSGRAALFGGDPRRPSNRRRVGAMLQESGVPETLKVREVVEMFARLHRRPVGTHAALDAAGLAKKAGAKTGALSGGERQRLYFALCIVGDPDVLFLDEPTVGLDVESRRSFWERIREMHRRGKTIVLTTHYLEEADALADRVVVVDRGEVVAEGTPREIKARVGGRMVRFRSPTLDAGILPGLPGVQRVGSEDGAFELYSTEPEKALEELFARGVPMEGLEVRGAGLEEAFVALTGKREG